MEIVLFTTLTVLLTLTPSYAIFNPLAHLFTPRGAPHTPQEPNKVDHMFNLLSDITPPSVEEPNPLLVKEFLPLHAEYLPAVESSSKNHVQKKNDNFEIVNQNYPHDEGSKDVLQEGFLQRFFEVANALSNSALQAADTVEGMVSTVRRSTKIYNAAKQKLKNEVFPPHKEPLQVLETKEHLRQEQSIDISNSSIALGRPSTLTEVLLDPPTLEGLLKAGIEAEDEEEILQHLGDLLVGVEDRSGGYGGGSALTLDPVTIIALLTLAAYLIRAVYQVLTVTGRSLDVDGFGLPLGLSDLPSAMTSLHNALAPSEFVEARLLLTVPDVDETSAILQVPGDLAALLRMYRNGEESCIKQFLCELFSGRRFSSDIDSHDIIMFATGALMGEWQTLQYLDTPPKDPSYCGSPLHVPQKLNYDIAHTCRKESLEEARRLQSFYRKVVEMIGSLKDSLWGKQVEAKNIWGKLDLEFK